MDKLYKVSEGIYRSARPLIGDAALLADLGIRSRLILESYSTTFPFDLHETYEPMSGWERPNVAHLKFLVQLIEDAEKPILINCQHGVDRTGIVVATYRILVEHRTVEDAWEEAQKIGMSKFLCWWKKVLYKLGRG